MFFVVVIEIAVVVVAVAFVGGGGAKCSFHCVGRCWRVEQNSVFCCVNAAAAVVAAHLPFLCINIVLSFARVSTTAATHIQTRLQIAKQRAAFSIAASAAAAAVYGIYFFQLYYTGNRLYRSFPFFKLALLSFSERTFGVQHKNTTSGCFQYCMKIKCSLCCILVY